MGKSEIIEEIEEQISKQGERVAEPFDTPRDAVRFGRRLERLYRAKRLLERASWW